MWKITQQMYDGWLYTHDEDPWTPSARAHQNNNKTKSTAKTLF